MYSKDSGSQAAGPPHDSATVVLLRDRQDSGFEVFLMRRNKNQSFMSGAYVFPGGRLDPEDRGIGPDDCADNFTGEQARQKLCEPDLKPATALGLYICAIRELFEEAGVLLATTAQGQPIDMQDSRASRYADYRGRLHGRKLSLNELAAKEKILLAPGLMLPYAHWITPEIEAKRFDTRFFLARLPGGQHATHDDVELVESLWISPEHALDKNDKREIKLMPPTLITLHELSRFNSLEDVFDTTRSSAILPIMPQAFKTDNGFGVKLPHDPEYHIADYKQANRPGQISRIVYRDKKWTAEVGC